MNAMNATKILMVLTLCVLLCLMMGLVVDQVHAQKGLGGRGIAGRGGDLTGDKDLASKQGLDIITSSKKKTDPLKMPTPLKKMVGVGSIFVMIAVVKWL
jgi:hypothetical protein